MKKPLSQRIDKGRGGVVYVAPALGPDVNQIAKLLESQGLLRSVVTRTVLPEGGRRLLSRCGFSSLSRRSSAPVDRSLVRMDPWADLVVGFQRLIGRAEIKAMDESFERVDQLGRRQLDDSVTAVMAREDACRLSFSAARQLEIPTIYQLPTAFYRHVKHAMDQEQARFPSIVSAEDIAHEFAAERCERKEAELATSDYVLCHCEFVKRTIPQTPALQGKVVSIPLGIDAEAWRPSEGEKLPVFLYVGNITVRKGVHRLLVAWKKLKAYRTHRLKLIGDMRISKSFLKDYQGMYDFEPRLHRDKLQGHYRSAQAFVFNAMADGFGHVFAEAMACGTPVLCSRNCGAPELVADGVEGRLFDYGDDEQLTTVLDWALSHPEGLSEMGFRARQRALAWGWDEFGAAFLNWLRSIPQLEDGK